MGDDGRWKKVVEKGRENGDRGVRRATRAKRERSATAAATERE